MYVTSSPCAVSCACLRFSSSSSAQTYGHFETCLSTLKTTHHSKRFLNSFCVLFVWFKNTGISLQIIELYKIHQSLEADAEFWKTISYPFRMSVGTLLGSIMQHFKDAYCAQNYKSNASMEHCTCQTVIL